MTVSVCIATYNGAAYIEDQLKSILQQLQIDDEIIVSDDKSTDNTCQLIKRIDDKRIILIENVDKKGVIGNFENALVHCKGDFIFLADQDDVWLPNKVIVVLEHLQKYEMVQSDATIIDSKGSLIHSSLFNLIKSKRGLFANIWKSKYVGCTMAFRAEVLSVALPFPKNIPMHDLWLGIVGEVAYTTNFISDRLILYRRHDANLSSTAVSSPNSFTRKIKYRVNIIRYIPLILWRLCNRRSRKLV